MSFEGPKPPKKTLLGRLINLVRSRDKLEQEESKRRASRRAAKKARYEERKRTREERYKRDLEIFQSKTGFHLGGLGQVFTRKSFAKHRNIPDQDVLELHGDKVLHKNLVEILAEGQEVKNMSEEDRKRIEAKARVLGENMLLSKVAMRLGMNQCLRIGSNELYRSHEPYKHVKMLADTLEAYLYELYVQLGDDAVKSFISRHIMPLYEEYLALFSNEDLISKLEEKEMGPDETLRIRLSKHPWVLWAFDGDALPLYPQMR